MNLIVIIILSVILIFLIFLIILIIKFYKKNRKLTLNQFAIDLNQQYQNFILHSIAFDQLPMKEDKLLDKDADVYYCSRALIGNYQNPSNIINNKNYDVDDSLKNNKIKISYHYKIINFGKSKFIPLDTIELLITKTELYIYHPLESEVVNLDKIKNLTIFWEQNRLVKTKKFFPGVAFQANSQNYFLLFQTYQQILKFLACINNISNIN